MVLRESPVPKPEGNEVLIEVKAAGICGTDIHIKHDAYPYWPPVIMGHEFSGVIVELGKEVTGFKLGDRLDCSEENRHWQDHYPCRTAGIVGTDVRSGREQAGTQGPFNPMRNHGGSFCATEEQG